MNYEDYKKFIQWVVWRKMKAIYCEYGIKLDKDDFMQDAYFSFIRARDTYDASKGKFAHWLSIWIRGQMDNKIRKERHNRVKMPVLSYDHNFSIDDQDEYANFLLQVEKLSSREKFIILNKDKGVKYIAKHLGITHQRVYVLYNRTVKKLRGERFTHRSEKVDI